MGVSQRSVMGYGLTAKWSFSWRAKVVLPTLTRAKHGYNRKISQLSVVGDVLGVVIVFVYYEKPDNKTDIS